MAPLKRNPVTDDEKAKAAETVGRTDGTSPAEATSGQSAAGNSAAPAEQTDAERNLAREQGAVVQEPSSEQVRRDSAQEKMMQQQAEATAAQRIREQFGAINPEPVRPTASAKPAAAPLFMFMSEYKELQIYVDLGITERDKDGQMIPRHYGVKFRNGIFKTTDARVAAAVRRHPRCGTKTFREELNAQAVALRAAASQARDSLRSPSFAGPTASSDGQDAVFHQQDNELARTEQQLFSL